MCQIGLEEKFVLLDTGSSVSIIKKGALPKHTKLDCTNVQISDLTNALRVLGSVKLIVGLNGIQVPVNFFVIEDWKLNIDLICGMNLINSVNANIDIGNSVMWARYAKQQTCVPLVDLCAKNTSYNVHCIEEEKIPAASQKVVFARVACRDGDYVLKQKQLGHPGLLVSDSVVRAKDGRVPVVFVNTSLNGGAAKEKYVSCRN